MPVACATAPKRALPSSDIASPPRLHDLPDPRSLTEMLVEEPCDFGKGLLGLGRVSVEQILRVRHALVDLQLRLDAGLAQLAMRQHRQAQEQVARSAGQDRRRKAVKIAVDRRQLRILQI